MVEHTEEKDKSKRFEIVGVEDADKIRKDLWNIINSKEKVNVNLLRDEDVQVVDVEGKSIVVIHVPRARYNLRPVFINNKMIVGNVFRRNHEGDFKCTQSDINAMIRDANEDGNDGILIDGMNVRVIVERKMPGQLVVPRSAVVVRDNLDVLFTYSDDGVAHWTYVNIIRSNGDSHVVTANADRGAKLNEGDKVIVKGNLNLADGSKVQLKK